jgi:hypothetical protein
MSDKVELSAKQYIDAALDMQRKLGYRADVPKESYEKAVKHAAQAFRDLRGTDSSG